HLPHERLLPPALVQRLLERMTPRDVLPVALDPRRLALALGRPLAQLPQLARPRRLLLAAERRHQRAVAHEVRVAPDRRGEVAVARRPQPGMTDVLRRVIRLP